MYPLLFLVSMQVHNPPFSLAEQEPEQLGLHWQLRPQELRAFPPLTHLFQNKAVLKSWFGANCSSLHPPSPALTMGDKSHGSLG